MRVLVTGGAGFIGSHIVDELLAAGHEPVVVDDLSSGHRANVPAGVSCIEADIRDRSALRMSPMTSSVDVTVRLRSPST